MRPFLVIRFGIGHVLTRCQGDEPQRQRDELASFSNFGATAISSALLGGVDALPAFTGRTVSGGRLNVLRSLRLVADVGVGLPAPAPEPAAARLGAARRPSHRFRRQPPHAQPADPRQ